MLPQLLLHVRPRCEAALRHPVLATIHQGVENLQAVVTHANRVGVREAQTEAARYLLMILHHDISLATHVLPRHLYLGEDVANQVFFEVSIDHGIKRKSKEVQLVWHKTFIHATSLIRASSSPS